VAKLPATAPRPVSTANGGRTSTNPDADGTNGCPVPHDALRAVQSARRHLRQTLVRLFPEVKPQV
jgi:hypothetical protein